MSELERLTKARDELDRKIAALEAEGVKICAALEYGYEAYKAERTPEGHYKLSNTSGAETITSDVFETAERLGLKPTCAWVDRYTGHINVYFRKKGE